MTSQQNQLVFCKSFQAILMFASMAAAYPSGAPFGTPYFIFMVT
jgi:hypothetical protein